MRENPIPNELKDIVDDIAFEFRRTLRDGRLSKYAITQAFVTDQMYTGHIIDMLLADKYKPQAKSKVDLANKSHLAWVKLLNWCLLNDMDCSGFPVFSKDLQVTIWNKTDPNTLHILPFARIGVKEEFEELIPDGRVLNNKYFTLLAPDQATLLQNNLIEKGVCVGEVVAKTSACKMPPEKLMSILSKSEPLPADKYHKLISAEPLISSIHFHDQIIGSVSQVPARAKLFLRFLTEVICQKDSAWRTETTVSCDCGINHKIVPAEWLAKIKCDSWVPVGKAEEIKQREATKESIYALMGNDGIKEILLSQYGVGLLEHLGYERLDLSIIKRSLEPE